MQASQLAVLAQRRQFCARQHLVHAGATRSEVQKSPPAVVSGHDHGSESKKWEVYWLKSVTRTPVARQALPML
ncbi:hypothetical protein H920_10490 [Fukomys damarensis]|uniref:Uncharacterized protein n=1 Tax=Fukomys damarensis TaxID=885580 RepID=A0A091DZ68_FUKDA|nr:hypothetical protein H920_10490 [Fukomys damarensis]